ncbi:MAG: hypothetical protein ABIJ97_08095 [Bacteroidota bacterium]
MEVQRILGKRHSEVVYKDALEYDPIAIGYKRIISPILTMLIL